MSTVQLLYKRYQDDAYLASKGGIIGFTQAWAGKIGTDGINSNINVPELTNTKTIKGINEEIFELLPTL